MNKKIIGIVLSVAGMIIALAGLGSVGLILILCGMVALVLSFREGKKKAN